MNLLLLERDEIAADGTVVLSGTRAKHIVRTLRAAPGKSLRAGILDGPRGHAEVLAIADDSVHLRVTCIEVPPDAPDVLLLAMPRPKVLQRLLEHAAALGFGRIVLFRSWRVEKSHLQSRVLEPDLQRRHLLAGLEQSQRTRLPVVQFFPLFKPFVEDVLPTLPLPDHRFCADPPATTATHQLQLTRGAAFALAIGPEGGWLQYQVEQLGRHGFLAVHCGHQPLRTESALAVLHGQLDLLRQQR